MLSGYEKLKLMRMQETVEERRKQIFDHRDLVPGWMFDCAQGDLWRMAKDLREAEDDDDPSIFDLYATDRCFDDDSPLAKIPDDWGITGIREWMVIQKRDLQDAIKRGKWRKVAALAIMIEELEAAILAKMAEGKKPEAA